ncbi:MAG: hypothetical protein LAC70_00370, partial [Methylovulum sp.]|nr:hypothetical protein [Methylovulum sp.]
TLTALSTDAAGNSTTATRTISLDSVAPSAPTINPVATDNSINSTEKAATVTVTGSNESGTSTTLNGNAVTQATATSWTYVLTSDALTAFGEGAETLTALSTDAAGNSTTATRDINVNAAGNGSRTTPATTQTINDDVLNATTGSILDVSAIAYNAANGNDEYIITLSSGNLINTSANIEISGFSAGDKLVFDADALTSLINVTDSLNLNTFYSVADDLTNVTLYGNNNNEGTVQIITLLGLTGSRTEVGGSIDSLTELTTYFGSSVIDII